jgi:hypothetical protein
MSRADNHARVALVAAKLKALGLTAWLDEPPRCQCAATASPRPSPPPPPSPATCGHYARKVPDGAGHCQLELGHGTARKEGRAAPLLIMEGTTA